MHALKSIFSFFLSFFSFFFFLLSFFLSPVYANKYPTHPFSLSFQGCKDKCRSAQLQGSCDSLSHLLQNLKEHGACEGVVSFHALRTICTRLLEQHPIPPASDIGGAGAPPPSHSYSFHQAPFGGRTAATLPEQAGASSAAQGSSFDTDGMFVDPEFKLGCYLFTQLFKG